MKKWHNAANGIEVAGGRFGRHIDPQQVSGSNIIDRSPGVARLAAGTAPEAHRLAFILIRNH